MGHLAAAIEILHERTAIYTRDPVVDQLLDMVCWPAGGRRLVEPSCGDGQFLVPALQRYLERNPRATGSDIAAVLAGYEVHPGAANVARGRLAQMLMTEGWHPEQAIQTARAVVHTADFLTDGPEDASADVVAGNPPYLRFAGVPAELRPAYLHAVPDYALADLLHAFLERCARLLRPGGEIAFVTADRWLFNEGAAKLRSMLGRRLAIHHAERLDASTAFYRPKQRRRGTPPRVHPVAVLLREGDGTRPVLAAAPFFPETVGMDGGGPRLADVAEVRLAPWLGKEGIFVVDQAVALRLPTGSVVPVVDTEELDGDRLGPLKRYAIRTEPDQEPPEPVLAHLRATTPGLTPRGRRTPFWMPPESWHHWDLSRETLLVPRITRQLRCIRLPAGVLPINHSLSVVAAEPGRLDRLEAYLNGPEARAWMRRAPPLENGFRSITTRLLRALPVPNDV